MFERSVLARAFVVVSSVLLIGACNSGPDVAPPRDIELNAAGRAIIAAPAKEGALTVTTPSFQPGGDIAFENTQYKGNAFPGLEWTPGPTGTTSYAIIIQDTDGGGVRGPTLHWTISNIPGTVTKLDSAMTEAPAGSQYGPNYKGAHQPYLGPATPRGPKHRYHFQVFALDTTLPADAMASYDAMIAAMQDHVLASGEVMGLGRYMTR